jgi:hypothetical protein
LHLNVDPVELVQTIVPFKSAINARPGESMREKEMVPSMSEGLNGSPPTSVGIEGVGDGRKSTDGFCDAGTTFGNTTGWLGSRRIWLNTRRNDQTLGWPDIITWHSTSFNPQPELFGIWPLQVIADLTGHGECQCAHAVIASHLKLGGRQAQVHRTDEGSHRGT